MSYEYTKFIPQNIAPYDTKKIVVYKDGVRYLSVRLKGLRYEPKKKLYSVGYLADIHEMANGMTVAPYSSVKLDNALTWFEEQGVTDVFIAGDITNHGFWNSDGTKDLTQFAEFKRIVDKHPNINVYVIGGNHDSYFKAITETEADWKTYTGCDLHYVVEKGNDLFIMVSQPNSTTPMSEDAFAMLKTTLQNSNGKRCFIVVHPFLSGDSGNALNVYGSRMFDSWSHTTELKTLLSQHNAMILHGHSHIKFDYQDQEDSANYTEKNGFHSMHIPSTTTPADIVDGERVQSTVESYGYIMDAYSDCVVFRARNFGTYQNGAMVNSKWIPIATYKIDMAEVS